MEGVAGTRERDSTDMAGSGRVGLARSRLPGPTDKVSADLRLVTSYIRPSIFRVDRSSVPTSTQPICISFRILHTPATTISHPPPPPAPTPSAPPRPAAVSIGATYLLLRTMAAASATRRGLSALLLSPSSRALRRRLGPLAAAASSPHVAPWPLLAPRGARTASSGGSGHSPLNDPSPNWSNRPPKETILLDGCDYEHWLIVMEFPTDPKPSEEEMVAAYVKTLAAVLGRYAPCLCGFVAVLLEQPR